MTSSKDMALNAQEMFDWVLNTEKICLGYLCFTFYQTWTFINERTVSSSNTIQSLATIRLAVMNIFFFDFEEQTAS